jgi:sarcosine oxidase subunit gamma
MSDPLAPQRASPSASADPRIATTPPANRFILRGDARVMSAAGLALGLSLPAPVCRAALGESAAGLWLGPDETLLLLPTDGRPWPALVGETLAGLAHSLVDVSHRQTALEISGPDAEAMLAVACPLDLHASAFPVGMCARTVFAKCEIVLWRKAPELFHVEVWRSFRAYVLGLLEMAALEFAGR